MGNPGFGDEDSEGGDFLDDDGGDEAFLGNDDDDLKGFSFGKVTIWLVLLVL
jgi:hypothetical protein